jgi:hypothetical protein
MAAVKGFPIPAVLARLGLVAGLAAYSWFYFTAHMSALSTEPGFFHNIHLVFHETGHVLFSWAPPLWHSLGGTIGQLAVPLALAIAFIAKNRDGFGAAICGWWLGHSLVDCAPYINDARKMQVTLLGGETGMEVEGHDWNFILSHLNLLEIDVHLSRQVLLAGRIVMAVSLIAAAAFAIRYGIVRMREDAEREN